MTIGWFCPLKSMKNMKIPSQATHVLPGFLSSAWHRWSRKESWGSWTGGCCYHHHMFMFLISYIISIFINDDDLRQWCMYVVCTYVWFVCMYGMVWYGNVMSCHVMSCMYVCMYIYIYTYLIVFVIVTNIIVCKAFR
jgi:hypothetical protein